MGGTGLMPAFRRTAGSRTITRSVQRVLVNRWGDWVHVPDMLCESITRGVGTAGASANFIVPRLRWDEAGDLFSGAEVLVYASECGSTELNSVPWFHGWLVTEPRRRSARENSYSVSAVSAIRLLDKVPAGLGGWTLRDWDGSRITSRRMQTLCPRYPRLSAMRNGIRRPLWHPRDILYDLISGLPSYWSQAVALGMTDALREEPYKTRGLVEWDFTAVSVLEAIETIVSAWGDVTFVERYTGTGLPRVYLDFYRIGESGGRGRKVVSLLACGSSSQIGVEEIGGTTEVVDRVDRVILVGAPYRVMITAWTGDEVAARRLRKGWVTKLVTIVQTYWDDTINQPVSRTVTKTNEEWVLDDPDYGRRGSDLFHPDCEYVFRRYKLPECLLSEGLRIESDNAVRQLQEDPADNDPKRLGRQVFKTRLTYSTRRTDYEIAQQLLEAGHLTSSYGYDCGGEYGYGYGYESTAGFRLLNLSQVDLVGEVIPDDIGGGQSVVPLELIDGATISDDGTVLLSEPAINVIYKGYCGNKEQIIRAEADVAVTITIAHEQRLTVDTGQPPYQPGRLSLVGQDGSILSDSKPEDWEYSQVTTLGNGPRLENGVTVTFPFIDPATGAEVHFDWCVYQQTYDPDADNPQLAAQDDNEVKILRHVTSQQVVRNDYPIMQELARRLLKLRSRPKRAYEVTLPVSTHGFMPGDLVTFEGIADVVHDDYTVAGVQINFDPAGSAFSTILSVDNAKPEESVRIEH